MVGSKHGNQYQIDSSQGGFILNWIYQFNYLAFIFFFCLSHMYALRSCFLEHPFVLNILPFLLKSNIFSQTFVRKSLNVVISIIRYLEGNNRGWDAIVPYAGHFFQIICTGSRIDQKSLLVTPGQSFLSCPLLGNIFPSWYYGLLFWGFLSFPTTSVQIHFFRTWFLPVKSSWDYYLRKIHIYSILGRVYESEK